MEEGGITHMPCSRSLRTFHIVIKAVGEEEIMMMGFEDLAFFGPRSESGM